MASSSLSTLRHATWAQRARKPWPRRAPAATLEPGIASVGETASTGLERRPSRSRAQALAKNGVLRRLHLSANPVGDAGAVALATAVEARDASSALAELILDHPSIGAEGARALADVARRVEEVQVLKVWHARFEQLRKSWAGEKVKEEL